jgi:E3 ubiquitin-protein ligase TRIP12
MSSTERRSLLKFVTGSGNMPIGGAVRLSPPMAVIKFEKEGVFADALLPASSVCLNALKLPPYSSLEILKSKILLAISDGKDSFLLD